MKTLILIRHAKSSWENFSVPDEERPLNARGKRDAPEMAERLRSRHVAIDGFFSSPAKRAMSTARFFIKAYGGSGKDIISVPRLYLADHTAFLDTVRQVPVTFSSIALFSHNDGITGFANSLSQTRIDDMPTCGVFAVRSPAVSWDRFEPGGNDFYFFDFPKRQ